MDAVLGLAAVGLISDPGFTRRIHVRQEVVERLDIMGLARRGPRRVKQRAVVVPDQVIGGTGQPRFLLLLVASLFLAACDSILV